MKRMLSLLLPVALAACATTTTPPAGTAQAGADSGTICDRDARTGSMLPTTRCTTAAEREAAKRDVSATAEAVRNTRSMQTKGSGS